MPDARPFAKSSATEDEAASIVANTALRLRAASRFMIFLRRWTMNGTNLALGRHKRKQCLTECADSASDDRLANAGVSEHQPRTCRRAPILTRQRKCVYATAQRRSRNPTVVDAVCEVPDDMRPRLRNCHPHRLSKLRPHRRNEALAAFRVQLAHTANVAREVSVSHEVGDDCLITDRRM